MKTTSYELCVLNFTTGIHIEGVDDGLECFEFHLSFEHRFVFCGRVSGEQQRILSNRGKEGASEEFMCSGVPQTKLILVNELALGKVYIYI